jgi:inositol-pentakisphosphate 2-kinase
MITVDYSESPRKSIYLVTEVDDQKSTTLEYLAEGNANVVYCFRPIAKNLLPYGVRHKLLRLRKDKSFIQSTESQAATSQREFVPLFPPENLVEQTLILLDEALIRRLNQELEKHESSALRQALRHSDRLAIDGHGLLMTDMTARHGEYLFEIKPKWLLQSPDAPGDSIRCRTCALRLQRTHATAQSAVMPKTGGFCPLSLVDDDIEERQRAFKSIIEAQAGSLPITSGMFTMMSSTGPFGYTSAFHLTFIHFTSVEIIVSFLAEKGYLVLKTLRGHQARFDKHGLLNSDL